MLRYVIGAAALLLFPGMAGAAELPRPEAAVSGPGAYASYRRHRHHGWRRAYRARTDRFAYGFDWPTRVTHPRWPSCYDRPPFHCPPPRSPVFIPVANLDLGAFPSHHDVAAPVVRHRWARGRVHRTVLRARG